MEPVNTITGTMVPLVRPNVDTDQIIAKQALKRVERTGFGSYLFYDWAHDSEGEPRTDFVLNDPAYRAARVLVTGRNFGSGSSREHAPWGLKDWGFRAIVAPSFADIFRRNCYKNGLLPVVLNESAVKHLADLAQEDPTAEVVVDLEAQKVTAAKLEATFEIDPFVKECLLKGLDEIDLTLAAEAEITRFEDSRPRYKPSV